MATATVPVPAPGNDSRWCTTMMDQFHSKLTGVNTSVLRGPMLWRRDMHRKLTRSNHLKCASKLCLVKIFCGVCDCAPWFFDRPGRATSWILDSDDAGVR